MEFVLNAAAIQTISEETVSVNSVISVTELIAAHVIHHVEPVAINSAIVVFHVLMLHILYQMVSVH